MERISSLDFLKGLALFFVVLIHAKPFTGLEGIFHEFGIVLLNLARFAVPCFFLIAGYLFSKKLKAQEDQKYAWNYLTKLIKNYGKAILIFLALNLGLFLITDYVRFKALEKAVILDIFGFEGLMNILYFGSAVSYHLWFLPALIISTAIVYIFQIYGRLSVLIPVSYVLHLLGVASGAYNFIPIPVQPRDPIFFGLFFVATGFYIAENNLEKIIKSTTALKLFALFAILHGVEGLFISANIPAVDAPSLDYSFFTALMALPLFIFILSRPQLGKETRLEKYGKNSLWIYIIHSIPISILIAVSKIISGVFGVAIAQSLVWQLIVTPLAFLTAGEMVLRCKN